MSSETIETKTRILQAAWQLMEAHRGQDISMNAIAKSVGISRQAVYLHFSSRTELMIETMRYVDDVKGLNARLERIDEASTGIELIDIFVDVWGNYIPEIYGLAKALLRTRDTDDAMAAAWDMNMSCLREVCKKIIDMLEEEGMLASQWSRDEATELLWAMLSITNWEQFIYECGWSNTQYVDGMKKLLKQTLVE